MRYRNSIIVALFALMAMAAFSGCAMKRDIVIVDDKINRIYADQRQMSAAVARLDSLYGSEVNESVKLRAEIRSSLGDLMEQFRMIQANMNDLQDKMNYMTQRESGRPVPLAGPKTDSADTAGASQATPGIDCQGLYDESFINVRRGQYDAAIQGFNEYLKYCGNQESADNAVFWIGESYYSMDRFKEAADEFALLLKQYPSSEKRPGALYKMARSYEELGRKSDAKATFKRLVDQFPGTLEADQAKEKLKELK